MATITKRILEGNYVVWRARIRRKGFPPEDKTFTHRSDAELWAANRENEMRRGVYLSRYEAESTTLSKALDRYEREITPTKRGAAMERYKIGSLRRSSLGAYFLANLRSADLATWRDARLKEAAPATVVRELALISHLFTVARKEWRMEGLSNPVQGIRKPSLKGTGRTRRLEPGEEQELMARARDYGEPLPSIIQLALETAMRRGELARLHWEYVDLKRRVIHLADTKNGDSRDVPLSSRAAEVLSRLPRRIDGWVFGIRSDTISQAFARITGVAVTSKQCARRKEIERLADLRFHDLRHEATSRFFELGLNPMQVATITGHKTMQMLKRYTHLRAEDLANMLG